jgi:putative ABC transport system permease protein
MKYLPFVLKHLKKNWIRTGSTVLAMSVCIFLFCTLQTVLSEINGMLESSGASRLVVRNSVSLVFPLPLSYAARIQALPGVKRVANATWFGGSLPTKKEGKEEDAKAAAKPDDKEATTDWSKFIPSLAVDAEPYFAQYPELEFRPEEWRGFLADLQGVAIGRKLANKYGWKIGDHFFLESFIPPYRKQSGPFEFVVQAIFDADLNKYPGTDTNVAFFHFKYLYEGTGQRISAGSYNVEVEDPDKAAAVGKSIDALFENSDSQTLTETEKAFRAGFIAMAGNLALLLNGIGLAVSFTILLVTANTMSMAVRERRTEIAVLKTLGFSSAKVMGLIVAEALALGAIGGLVGTGGSQAIMYLLTHTPGLSDMLLTIGLSTLTLKPGIGLMGFAVALFLGLAAGFVPAWNAYRSKITDMLRTV